MSNYHIMQVSQNEEDINVVFHIPVPVEVNFSGVSLSTAFAEQQLSAMESGATIVSQYPRIGGTELGQIKAGEILELVRNVRVTISWTDGEKRNYIDGMFGDLTTENQDRIRSELHFWGYDRDVP